MILVASLTSCVSKVGEKEFAGTKGDLGSGNRKLRDVGR